MKVSPNIQTFQAMFDNPKLRPSYAHGVEDAGCDLKAYIAEPLTIEPWKSAWVGTGVHLAMPYGMFALQAPRSDGVTYPSISAAAHANHIAETTMKRYVRSGKKTYSGFSFSVSDNQTRLGREHLSEPAVCPMCGRNTYNITGFCQYCYRDVRALNRKEDAYRAASVVA